MRDLYDPLLAFRGLSDEPDEEEGVEIEGGEEEEGEELPEEEGLGTDEEGLGSI